MSSLRRISQPDLTTGFQVIEFETDTTYGRNALERFHELGFSASFDNAYLDSVTQLLSNHFANFLSRSLPSPLMTREKDYNVCGIRNLFGPWFADAEQQMRTSISVDYLNFCLKAICRHDTFNPDLAGIGVLMSFILQMIIALGSGAALVTLKRLKARKNWGRDCLTDALTVALVEFHRNQCCFAIAIEIATIVNTHSLGIGRTSPFLLVLSGVGLIPVTFTLVCLSYYGRPSWYLNLLSLATYLSSTAVLLQFSIALAISKRDLRSLSFSSPIRDFTETMDIPLRDVDPICGNLRADATHQAPDPLILWWAWASWLYCGMWITSVMSRRSHVGKPMKLFSNWLGVLVSCKSNSLQLAKSRSWSTAFFCAWATCFALQLYSLSTYTSGSFISMQWSFGQIVSVAVWVPSLAEFLYIHFRGMEVASEYKYPPPWRAARQE